MTYDTTKLVLIGRPKCNCVDCNVPPEPASIPLKNLGFNSHVIKPETRVNKAEDAEQPTQQECDNAMVEGFERTMPVLPKIPEQHFEGLRTIDKLEQQPQTRTGSCLFLPNCGKPTGWKPCPSLSEQPNQQIDTVHHKFDSTCNCLGCMPMGATNLIPEQPNLKIIEEIEGLISQVNDKLDILDRKWAVEVSENKFKRMTRISQALEDIDIFQKTTLVELRRAFE